MSRDLSFLINSSLYDSVFLSLYKYATFTPIHKAGKINQVGNYRSISVLPILSKVYESAIYNRLTKLLCTHDKFICHQFGFLPVLSIVDAIDYLLE